MPLPPAGHRPPSTTNATTIGVVVGVAAVSLVVLIAVVIVIAASTADRDASPSVAGGSGTRAFGSEADYCAALDQADQLDPATAIQTLSATAPDAEQRQAQATLGPVLRQITADHPEGGSGLVAAGRDALLDPSVSEADQAVADYAASHCGIDGLETIPR